ncbi:MAG: prephenate dehydratase domain-containing protein [Thermodesulfobacteriota bacterium]
MASIATIGPEGSHAWQAARQYDPQASIVACPHMTAVFEAFQRGEADYALVPVYNTREGHSREFFEQMRRLAKGCWAGNTMLAIHLSLGSLDQTTPVRTIIAKAGSLRQCRDYLSSRFPDATLIAVNDLEQAAREITEQRLADRAVIDTEEVLKRFGLALREREITPYNSTRFALIGREMPPATGYDATAVTTEPLKDRVGILYELLGEFSGRGINLLDMQTETDPASQKLRFFFEMEGHAADPAVAEALARIERQVVQERDSLRVLGSYRRLDMRTKRIRNFGFIGSGDMSLWFARQLASEGYETLVTGRSTELRPEQMIPQVDVVVVCVPISATEETIRQYGPLLRDDQALILLAGAAENILKTALRHTSAGVEVLLVHNLWGPKAATMKDKNASVVRTSRSGVLCSEFESFLYKHGAHICLDSPNRHDLMMGVSQKLPTAISIALAMTLAEKEITPEAIESHSTLTSLYSILSMARVHIQNARTYGEILASPGEGRTIAHAFAANLGRVLDLADQSDIAGLCALIETNRAYLTDDFLRNRMRQALEVDKTLGRVISR